MGGLRTTSCWPLIECQRGVVCPRARGCPRAVVGGLGTMSCWPQSECRGGGVSTRPGHVCMSSEANKLLANKQRGGKTPLGVRRRLGWARMRSMPRPSECSDTSFFTLDPATPLAACPAPGRRRTDRSCCTCRWRRRCCKEYWRTWTKWGDEAPSTAGHSTAQCKGCWKTWTKWGDRPPAQHSIAQHNASQGVLEDLDQMG